MIHRFETPGLAQYAYLIASNGEAAVIDPIRDIEPYLDYARDHSLTITHVLETHIHADFASGATALAAATGAALALSAYDAGELYHYAMPHQPLHSGDSITVGALRLEAIHTPGHTPEHLSFLLFNNSSTEPEAIFSGDFLFVGSLGRPDLLGDAAKLGLARELYRSVHERIAGLPGDLRIYPGHGAGSFCGSGMSELAESTLAVERATNPLLQLDEPTFLDRILGSVPPMPSYYPRIKQLNADGAPIYNELPGSRSLSPAELRELHPETILLDLRDLASFAASHIPGSVNIGSGPSLSLWAGWLLDPTANIVLIDDGDSAAIAARLALLRVGLDNITGHLAGGFHAWQQAGLPTSSTRFLTATQIPTSAFTLDVRNVNEFSATHLPGAQHIPLGDLQHHIKSLPLDQPITLVCEGGYRASIAASLLARHGLNQLSILEGGMEAWHRAQTPLSSKL